MLTILVSAVSGMDTSAILSEVLSGGRFSKLPMDTEPDTASELFPNRSIERTFIS